MATQTRVDRAAVSGRNEARRAHRIPTDPPAQSSTHRSSHRLIADPCLRRRSRAAAALFAAVATVFALVVAIPASADPSGSSGAGTSTTQPKTSTDAKDLWLKASADAEAANEDVLQAQQVEKQAQDKVAATKVTLAQANLKASAAQAASVQAAAQYAMYRDDLAQFASASFRGARLGQLSALLTAGSTADYLDEVSSLDQVAGSTRVMMLQALAAREAADDAQTKAADAQADATAAATAADQALQEAHDATTAVTERKATLDAQVATYQRLYSELSSQERAAAMQAQQAAWQQQSEQAAAQLAAEGQVAGQVAGAAAPNAQALSAPADGAPPAAVTAASPKAQIAVDAALSKLGDPYVFGAAGPNAFDCSGLTSWAWAQAGVSIPRTSSAQAGLPVVPLSQLQPGDLITYYSPVHHVAMYIGNGQIIHASTEGVPVYITSMYRGGPYPVGHRVNY